MEPQVTGNSKTHQNETFLAWIEAHGAVLRKVARAYAVPGEHAGLHQELLIAVWRAVPLFRGHAKPSTFIYRVALNRAMSWSRDEQTYRRRYVELEEKVAAAAPVEADDRAATHQRVEQLYAALAELPEADRSLALMYLDDLSYREMAEVLGISESNAGVRLTRIRKRLTEQLRKESES